MDDNTVADPFPRTTEAQFWYEQGEAAARQAVVKEALGAVDLFAFDMAFTAPELFPMRLQQLRENISALLAGEL